MVRARLPPPSRIPSSAVEMPGAGDSLSKLDVQFGGMDLQFGGSSANDSNNSNMEFNAAPGQGLPSSTTPSKDSSYGHSIQSVSSVGKGGDTDSTGYIAPGQPVKGPDTATVNQSLSSALSAAGIKTSHASSDSVPGYSSGSSGSRSSDKYGGSTTQRSPGPALISKPDYVSQYSGYGQSSAGGQSKSNYNSYSGSSQTAGYDRQNSSGYSGSNGLNSSYGGGSGGSSSYAAGGQSGSSYAGSNNFSSSYGGAATTASGGGGGGGYSSFSSNNSYSGKSGGSSQNSNSYLPAAAASTVGSSLSQLETSTAASSGKSAVYGDTATVSAASGSSSSGGLGLSSVTSSSKMSVGGTNASSGNKLVPGMPPGVGVLPAQYMTPAGFPAYLAAGLGQPGAAAAMYGSAAYGHQLEDLAALQRSTLAA